MSFFGSQCCGKGVEGENDERPSVGRRAAAKTRCKTFFRKMSFWRLEGCGKGMRGVFAFDIGSESEPRDEPIR